MSRLTNYTGFRRVPDGTMLANCSSASTHFKPPCNCSVPPALAGLKAFLTNIRGKAKFLEAAEQVLSHEPDVCVGGSRMLDVGAGGGEFTRWLAERCSLCVKAYDVALPGENPYSLLPGSNTSSRGAGGGGASDRVGASGSLGERHFASFRVWPFDGVHVPESNRSFELVVLNSMLHHAAANAPALLREAARVTTRHVLVFEDLAVPEDERITARHRIHDAHGIFRTQPEWEELFADAGFRVDMMGPVGSAILSSFKSQKHARLDWRHQRFFLLRLGARRRIPEANASTALTSGKGIPPDWTHVGKRRCSRLGERFGAVQCHDVSNSSRANFFYVHAVHVR